MTPSRARTPLVALTSLATAAVLAGGFASAAPADAAVPTTLHMGPGTQTLNPGTQFPIRVRLVSGSHELPNETVTIYFRNPGQTAWRFWHHVVTDSQGYAQLPYTANSSEQFTAVFTGDDVYSGSSGPVYTFSVAQPLGREMVAKAASHAGAPYEYGAAGPNAFDCSGLTMYVARQLGRSLPHNAAEQYADVQHVPASQMRPGDLVFFTSGGSIYHVGIYAGRGEIWHAPHSGTVVQENAIWTSSYLVGRLH